MRPAASGPPLFEVTTKNDRAARRYELQSDFAFKRRRLPGGQSGMQPFHDIFVNLTLFFAAKTDIIGYAWNPVTVAKQVAQIAKDEFVPVAEEGGVPGHVDRRQRCRRPFSSG